MALESTIKRPSLVDPFGRVVDYVRLSVTDRCDFRCVYCMAEEMTFLPREKLLTLEEMAFLGQAFVELGVNKIRLTGGEPLIRSNVLSLTRKLGQLDRLNELLITTNGSKLGEMAQELADSGVNRINVSLDSLHQDRFKAITRFGKLGKVLTGIQAAQQAGIERIKLNAVIVRGQNDDEIVDLVNYAREQQLDISFIEEMPLGNIGSRDRFNTMVTSQEVRGIINQSYPLIASTETSAGPSRYYRMQGSDTRIGFISPNSHNFCGSCNRVRVTCEGRLLLCLGNEHSYDLRAVMRHHPGDMEILKNTIVEAITLKPERHYFHQDDKPQVVRFMNSTGG